MDAGRRREEEYNGVNAVWEDIPVHGANYAGVK